MKQTVTFILLSLLLAVNTFSQISERAELQQKHFYINDEIAQGNLFSPVDSKMIDTSSIRFITAKNKVLDYCNKHLAFRMDTVAIHYSCREYREVNPHTNKDDRKWIKEKQVKYEFFISFRVSTTIDYHISFYLDSLLEVQDASEYLFKIKKARIWNIIPWSQISEQVFTREKDYILPLGEIDLEYDSKYKRFVYVLIQQKTDKTKIQSTSEFSGNYDLNKLIINSETGTILKRTKEFYSYIAEPSW